MGKTLTNLMPPKVPCGSCPYRRDVPAGIWDRSEYVKLRAYDRATWGQPPGLFMCHQQTGCICGGWLLTHDRDHLLALRIHAAKLDSAVWVYAPAVDVFPTGTQAAIHGISGIKHVSRAAQRKIDGLLRQRQRKAQGNGNENL